MSARFLTLTRDGHHWLPVSTNNKLHWLHPMAKLGDCPRPGQRLYRPITE